MHLSGKPMQQETFEFSVVTSTVIPGAYSEPCQTSKMERFAKIINGEAVNYFRKMLHLRCLTGL